MLEVREELLIRIQNRKNGDVLSINYERYDYVHYFHCGFMDYAGGTGIHGEGFTQEAALAMFMKNLEDYYESGP